jgi:DNA mismatch endonuclease (patch repair protein)
MADVFSKKKRREIMRQIGGVDTKPERLVRSLIHNMGLRFRLHRKDLPGKPDIVLPRFHGIIFVHGCFWHGHSKCRRSALPTTNKSFWSKKIDGNKTRDARINRELKALGWNVLTVWQCQTKDLIKLRRRIAKFIDG